MPVLVRWERSTDSVTLRGVELTEAGELLPDHAILHGVEGIEDNDHPDLDCVSIFIPRSEISYVVVCKVNNKNKETQEPEPEPEPKTEVEGEEVVSKEPEGVSDGERNATGTRRIRRTRSFRNRNG